MNVTDEGYNMSSYYQSNKRKADDNNININHIQEDFLADEDEIDAMIVNMDNNDDDCCYQMENETTATTAASTSNTTEESSYSSDIMYRHHVSNDEIGNNLSIADDQSFLTTGSRIGSLTGTSKSTSPSSMMNATTTGRPSIQLYLTCDNDAMSPYQCFVRKQVELFEANMEDVETNAQGRNKPIVLGQVGVRCRHCNILHPKQRTKGAVYYPTKLDGIYQAVNNMANIHLEKNCQMIDDQIRQNLISLRHNKSISGGGKNAWAERAGALGVFEDNQGLRFEPSIGYRHNIHL